MRPPVTPMSTSTSSITRPSLSTVTPCQEPMSSFTPQPELFRQVGPSVASKKAINASLSDSEMRTRGQEEVAQHEKGAFQTFFGPFHWFFETTKETLALIHPVAETIAEKESVNLHSSSKANRNIVQNSKGTSMTSGCDIQKW